MSDRKLLRTNLGLNFSEGARLLWLKMQRKGWSQTDLAGKLETSSGVVCRWLYGDRRPTLEFALVIQRVLGIAAGLWHAKPVTKFVLPANDARPRTGTDG
jgi:transcriptional regulator with XRE-family HTH domain